MIRALHTALLSLAAFLSPAPAQELVRFPMDADGPAALGVLELDPRRTELAALAERTSIRMVDVELPDERSLELILERIDFDFGRVGIHVDGAFDRWGHDVGDLSLWKGRVAGAADSNVWLALSSLGSYGWIQEPAETWHLGSFVETGTDWTMSRARWIADDALGAPSFDCLSDRLQRLDDALPAAPPAGNTGGYQGVALECAMAVETDYQLFQHWGSLPGAQAFVMALIAALSDRFLEQTNVVITYPYVMFYTDANDPWTTQETGGDAGDLLGEFRAAWAGAIPGGAHLAHFLSGAGLGGGVAWVDVLCNQQYGFAVSSGIDGGVQFPVQQGSGTWDFFVFAHETGHQFGSPHTFDYVPQIDDCPNVCISNGTNMSYCHGCPGGMNNITTYFHPRVVDRMRAEAVASCLPPACFEDPLAGNHDCASATGLAQGHTPGLEAVAGYPDHHKMIVAAGGGVRVDVRFTHAEGNIDARLMTGDCGAVLFSSTSSTDDEAVVFNNGSGEALIVVLEVELVAGICNDYDLDFLRIGPDPCDLPPDGLEENDACFLPAPLAVGVHSDLNVSQSDPDYYALDVPAGATLYVDMALRSEFGDVDMFLYAPGSCGGGAPLALAFADGDADLEQLSWTNVGGAPQPVRLEVVVPTSSFSECNTYSLAVDLGGAGPIGSAYCTPAASSSTGFPARILATGSPAVAAGDVTLTASVLPPGQFGYFLGSETSGFVAMPGGSQGNLCLGENIGRFVTQTQSSGASGSFAIPVDLTAIPTSPPSSVTIGDTWFFQAWFRDVNPDSTSNFTDGVTITFLF